MIQNDDKVTIENEGNVVIRFDSSHNYEEEGDIFMNNFDETHAYNSNSSIEIENTNLAYELEKEGRHFLCFIML